MHVQIFRFNLHIMRRQFHINKKRIEPRIIPQLFSFSICGFIQIQFWSKLPKHITQLFWVRSFDWVCLRFALFYKQLSAFIVWLLKFAFELYIFGLHKILLELTHLRLILANYVCMLIWMAHNTYMWKKSTKLLSGICRRLKLNLHN